MSSPKKKLALFTARYPYGMGETFLHDELFYLREKFQIFIVPLRAVGVRREVPDGVTVLSPIFKNSILCSALLALMHFSFYRIFCSLILDSVRSLTCLTQLLRQSVIIAQTMRYVVTTLDREDVDVWYFYWGTNSVNALSHIKRCPFSVSRFHGYDLYGDEVFSSYPRILHGRIAKKLNLLVFISEHGCRYFTDLHPLAKGKSIVSRLGVEFKGLGAHSSDRVLRVVSCSVINSNKRVHAIAESLSRIRSFNIEWTHFGSGPEFSIVRSLVRKFPRNIEAVLKGHVPREQILKHYQSTPVDLFINVSQSEGVPVSIMEASSYGIPSIVTTVGGSTELFPDSYEYLLKPQFLLEDLVDMVCMFYQNDFKNLRLRETVFEKYEKMFKAEYNYSTFTDILNSRVP